MSMRLSPMRRRAVELALRLYPRWWRTRYGAEVLDLVDATGISWRHVAGLAFNGWSERLRGPASVDHSLVGATVRLGRATGLAFVASTFTLGVVYGALLAYIAVVRFLYRAGGPDLEWYGRLFSSIGKSLVLTGSAYYLLGLVFALPVVLLLLFTGLARRFPRIARTATVAAFLAFPIDVVGLPRISSVMTLEGRTMLAALVAGWCFALVLYPRSRTRTGEPVLDSPRRFQ